MKKSDIENQNDNYSHVFSLVILSVLASICFLTIGYSAFSNTLSIESILATVAPVADVRVSNVTVSNTSGGGYSSSETFNMDRVYGTINLPNASSTVTYKVDVTVFLSQEMILSSLSGLNSDLEYTLSDYTLGDIICSSTDASKCNLGATHEMYITIGYKSGAYNGSNTSYPFNINFNFDEANIVAKIGNTRYQSLQDAINDVPTDNTETTIHLLKNTAEVLTVAAGKNITFNMHGNTISNNGTANVIVNDGTIHITNGTIHSTASQGAVHNHSTGKVYMSGGTISVTSSAKQAIYNEGGRVEISGGTMISDSSQNRPCVHNLSNGTMIITGGTITSNRQYGVQNESGTLTIGVKDGNPANTPVITGKTYGVNSSVNFNYYDGLIKGVTNAFNDETLIADTETTMTMIRATERIDGANYKTVQLGIPITITFNANGGSVSPTSKSINTGSQIGALPTPTKSNFIFDGWYDDPDNGNEITENTTFNSDDIIYAHWIFVAYAKIGNTEYASVFDALNAVPNNTATTIDIVKDMTISTAITIETNKNVTFDLNNHTISNSGNIPLFENKGTAIIKNGTLTSNAEQGAVNNRQNGAKLTIDNMTIIATGTRQAIYNEKGNTTITGNSHLSSTSNERPTVHNKNSGSITILSATIESSNYSGVGVEGGTITIGNKDGNISTTNPSIKGATYGAQKTSGTLNYYDGVLKGITDAINTTPNDTDGTIVNGVEGNYITAHLE